MSETWLETFIKKLLHPLIISSTAIFLLVLNIAYIWNAFEQGTGIRSVAATLVPAIVVIFIYQYNASLLDSVLGRGNAATRFFIGLVWGISMVLVIRYLGNHVSVPIPEFLLSATFSLLVLGNVSSQDGKLPEIPAYYYGMVVGTLFYVMLFGAPEENWAISTQNTLAPAHETTETPISTSTPTITPSSKLTPTPRTHGRE